ncbi:substrate-binding domain-containing protein [Conexibacter sp. JD483]|uniref:substrate-binding domain-containing protein n=1 Tax=unclassified Conexibacter TaxID=2627773 RepID=UPI002724646D|nr:MULTISPECIES: substrate-binding domain-containing protein [unclassified Conexibacter]MDO8185307.1 substrate-binding domain-containing protein [Conexibacter sp. CPCC 205706]MDO8198353.1 substrate-binding domain-containing protein [Conexibacter sp. CPCC 205762]MDR9370540.1 substrate-binding domain-containing protein [Conexibacter sp. JD483]
MSFIRTGTAVVLAGALALGAAACGSSDDNGGGGTGTSASGGGGDAPKIALLLPESKTARYENQDRPSFVRKVRELCPGCEVIYANAEQDAAQQQQQAEQAITNGAKVLVIDAVDVRAAAAIANNARTQGVPVVSYARLIDGADIDAYVSIDPFRVGQQQGEALLRALPNGGSRARIVMINGSPTDSNSAPYKQGAHDVLDRAGVDVVKEYDTPDWSPDKAQTEMEQAITAAGKDGFAGVYSANDGMAGGAIAAMRANGIDPRTKPVTGQDAEVAGLQRILTGEQLMTVYQPINQIASTAAELAVPLARGEGVPTSVTTTEVDNNSSRRVPSVLLDTIAITRDNIQSVIVRDGFATAAQICTDAYRAACDAAGIR